MLQDQGQKLRLWVLIFFFLIIICTISLAFNHISHASFENVKIQETLSTRIFTKISGTTHFSGLHFLNCIWKFLPSSVFLSLSQGKNQRLNFNKMILFTWHVYCAIETFLHIPDVSIGNFLQLCH